MKLPIYILFAIVMLGSATLLYFQHIDGTWNPPITFKVDTQALETDKPSYGVGQWVSVHFSYCRLRAFTTRTQWQLVDDTVIFFPEQSYLLKPECIDKFVAIGQIPPYTILGTHHLEGMTQIQLNPLKTMQITYKTKDFNVTP